MSGLYFQGDTYVAARQKKLKLKSNSAFSLLETLLFLKEKEENNKRKKTDGGWMTSYPDFELGVTRSQPTGPVDANHGS